MLRRLEFRAHVMAANPDQLLLGSIRAGDASAWEQFIARYEARLLAFARSRLHDEGRSEDVVQETFIGFLTSLPNYDAATPIEAFLFSIAAHKLTDALRRMGRRQALPLLMPNPDGADIEPAGPARRASSLFRSRDLRKAEEEVLKTRLTELINVWLQTGYFERLKCAELLFVLGWPNKRVAEELAISEQDVANHKAFIVGKLKEAADRSGLSATALARLER